MCPWVRWACGTIAPGVALMDPRDPPRHRDDPATPWRAHLLAIARDSPGNRRTTGSLGRWHTACLRTDSTISQPEEASTWKIAFVTE